MPQSGLRDERAPDVGHAKADVAGEIEERKCVGEEDGIL